MTKSAKSEFQKVLQIIVASAEKRLSHLPAKQAAAARKNIRRLAAATAKRSAGKVRAPKLKRGNPSGPEEQ